MPIRPDPEFHIPSPDTEYPMPAEERLPADESFPLEEAAVCEEVLPREEAAFSAGAPSRSASDEEAAAARRRRLRRLFMKPAAVLVATVTVLSSFGIDPLAGRSRPDIPSHESSEPSFEVTGEDIVRLTVNLTWLPTGEKTVFEDAASLDDALDEARAFIEEHDGDPDTLSYVRKRSKFAGFEAGGTFYEADDEDDAAALPEEYQSGEGVSRVYEDTYWYEAGAEEPGSSEEETETETAFDDAFPNLPNLEPDFAGDYSWSGEGSEVYLLLNAAGESAEYLVAGSYWTDHEGAEVRTIEGADYDRLSNTLTLTNFNGGVLNANQMGNGFTLKLVGENHLDRIMVWGAMYGGSLTITGTGSLTIDSGASTNGPGILLLSEVSESCLMIDRDVTVDITGSPAILVGTTTAEKGIWYLKPQVMTGGEQTDGIYFQDTVSYRDQGADAVDFVIADETGQPVDHVRFSPDD